MDFGGTLENAFSILCIQIHIKVIYSLQYKNFCININNFQLKHIKFTSLCKKEGNKYKRSKAEECVKIATNKDDSLREANSTWHKQE